MIRDTASPELQAAAPEWAPVAGELIYLTMGTVADYLFGGGDPEQAQAALARLFEADANIFSHQLAVAVIVGGQPVGMLVSGPWEVMQRLQVPTAFAIGRTSGMAALVRLAIRSLPLMGAPKEGSTSCPTRPCCRDSGGVAWERSSCVMPKRVRAMPV
jgi:hypothetical protein